MPKSAIYVLGSDGNITRMFVNESGFNVTEIEPNEYSFSTQSSNEQVSTIQAFDVSDQCNPEQTELSKCLNKTEIRATEESLPLLFYGNVLYLFIPQVSFTKYILDPSRNIIMTREGPIVAHILQGSQPETNSLIGNELGTELSSMQNEPDTSIGPESLQPSSTESTMETNNVSGEHEIVIAFNLAKGIVDSITQPNSSNSTATTESMTHSTLSSLNPFKSWHTPNASTSFG